MSRETENNIKDLISKGTIDLRITLSDDQIGKLIKYAELIKKWNNLVNITSIVDDKEIVLKHFLDSLLIVLIEDLKYKKVIDIGSGAGLPGIPLKIFYNNDIEITLLDSSSKKINIVKEMCNELGLYNIIFINKNAEEAGLMESYREKFDFSLIRAVSSMNIALEYSVPLLKINGRSVLYKGPNVDKEVENSARALELLKAKVIKNTEFIIPLSDYRRKIVVVEKKDKTDDKFPRRSGMPRKKPL